MSKFNPFLYKIRNRLSVFFLLSALIPLLVFGTVLLIFSNREMENEISETYATLSEQVNALCSEYVTTVDGIARSADVTDDISEYLRLSTGYFDCTIEQLINAENSARSFLQQLVNMNQSIYTISAVSLDGKMLTCSKSGGERPLYNWNDEYYSTLKSSTGNVVIMPVRNSNYAFSKSIKVFSVAFKHIDRWNNSSSEHHLQDYTGYIIIECPISRLSDFCRSINTGNGVSNYIFDEENRLMFSNDKLLTENSDSIAHAVSNAINKSVISVGKNKYMPVSAKSSQTGWTALTLVPYKVITQRLLSIRVIFLLLCVFLITSICAVSFLLSDSFTKPIRKMQSAMSEVEEGNFSVHINNDRYDEFGDLYTGFNVLIGKLNTSINTIADARKKAETATYHMLMSQINPHFLYNTLDSIRMLAIIKKQPEISQSLLSLSKLFRYSINSSELWVTVEEELNQAKSYLSLQNLRFQDELEINYEIDSAALNEKMPKILLQPILENSFTHAFDNINHKAVITLGIRRCPDRICFNVSDNGIGMNKNELEQLRLRLLSDSSPSGNGVGLLNINQRLRLHFSQEHWLHIESRSGFGTQITFSVPLSHKEAE